MGVAAFARCGVVDLLFELGQKHQGIARTNPLKLLLKCAFAKEDTSCGVQAAEVGAVFLFELLVGTQSQYHLGYFLGIDPDQVSVTFVNPDLKYFVPRRPGFHGFLWCHSERYCFGSGLRQKDLHSVCTLR